MHRIKLLLCSALVLAFPQFSAVGGPFEADTEKSPSANLPQSAMFRIRDPQGIVIGVQTESYETLPSGRVATRESRLSFAVDGHEPINLYSRTKITHSSNGASVSFEGEFSTLHGQVQYHAEISQGTATITRDRLGEKHSYLQTLPEGMSIADPDGLIAHINGEFLAFDPSLGRFVPSEARTVIQSEKAPTTTRLRVIYRGNFPVDARTITIGLDGSIESASQPQPGGAFRFEPVAMPGEPINIENDGRISHPMVASPHNISDRAKSGHIRYRVSLPGELAEALPQTAQQSVTLTADGPQLDICAACGPGLPTDEESLARWTSPTDWLQSDFEPIAERGAAMRNRGYSDRHKLELLARFVRNRVSRIDYNGHYSARVAWERRAGDCTEEATLLAAYARASGIPTLVASGLAYSRERYHGTRNAFIPHAWIIAYADGEWISYDMTLEEGFGASHIALSLGEGEASEMLASNLLAGLLQWRGISEVRRRQ